MKGYIKFLLIGALFFGVASVQASCLAPHSIFFQHPSELKKAVKELPAVTVLPLVYSCFAIADVQLIDVERVDNEVLVIRNDNEAVAGNRQIVLPVAHAPPNRQLENA